MRWTPFALVFAAGLLGGCDAPVATDPAPTTASEPAGVAQAPTGLQSFFDVVRSVEPIAKRECHARTSGVKCNFKIIVDERPNIPANAFQTIDNAGRPIIIFTQALIDDARNADELAFVLGHEAAHHIAGHIARQERNAVNSAVVAGSLTVLLGGNAEAVELAQRAGGYVGARTYSKAFELEADSLGTIITARAGYDPLHGAQFFARIPDPGDRFLGTHPPNSQRLETVRRTAAGL